MTESVDYDIIAPAYDKRYERNRYDGVRAVLQRFAGPERPDIAEVGCGTGHWLAELCGGAGTVAGLDSSIEMLRRARGAVPSALLVRGTAETLPWATARFDRLFCINAIHHFRGVDAFLKEARRVLRPAGALLIVGLDPHTRLDEWWVYDYFPGTLKADRARYLSTATIRERLTAAGFGDAETQVAQHIAASAPFADGVERGLIDRRATSQLMVISDAEYEDGVRRLRADQPILRSDLWLYATIARAPERSAA